MSEAKIVKGKDGELQLDNFYTQLTEARKEIRKRWKNEKLKKKINEFLGNDIPEIFKKEPRAVFARHVATPNLEHQYFLRKSSVAELTPLFLEYLSDKFSPENAPKYYLGKTFFIYKKGKNGGYANSCKKLIDFNKSSGKPLNKISLHKNDSERLVDFHHNFLEPTFPNISRYDISDWYKKKGGKPEKYYKHLLALFLRNGIMFENFLLNEEEINFTKQVVIPSFQEVEKYFNIKPLIVRLLPSSSESDPLWYWYPGSVEKYFSL